MNIYQRFLASNATGQAFHGETGDVPSPPTFIVQSPELTPPEQSGLTNEDRGKILLPVAAVWLAGVAATVTVAALAYRLVMGKGKRK